MSIIHPLAIIQHHGPCIAMPEKDEALFKLALHSHPSSIKLFPDLLLNKSNLHPAELNLDTQLWLSQLHSRNCKTQLFKLNSSQVSPHRRKSSNCAAATDFPNSFLPREFSSFQIPLCNTHPCTHTHASSNLWNWANWFQCVLFYREEILPGHWRRRRRRWKTEGKR